MKTPRQLNRTRLPGSDVPASNYSRPAEFRRRRGPRLGSTPGSVFDDPSQELRHPGPANRADGDFAGAPGCLQHLPVAQIHGDVLAAARSVEDQVAAAGLVGRNVAAEVVLVPGKARDQHADA